MAVLRQLEACAVSEMYAVGRPAYNIREEEHPFKEQGTAAVAVAEVTGVAVVAVVVQETMVLVAAGPVLLVGMGQIFFREKTMDQ